MAIKKGSLLDALKKLLKTDVKKLVRGSVEWLASKMKGKGVEKRHISRTVKEGRMVTFKYDAKHKATLPYWDRNPLVIVLHVQGNSFLGLNLHYLGPRHRAIFLDRLMSFSSPKRFRVTYDLLKASKRLKYYRPTIKRYLKSHVKSQFIEIPSEEWKYAITLPTQRFVGATSSKVYADSRKMI